MAYAQRQEDHVATWVTQLGPLQEGSSPRVVNVVFRARAAEHEAELHKRWSGPLCVVEHDAPTSGELERVRAEAEELLRTEGGELLASSTAPHLSLIEIWVVADPGEALQMKMEDRFGSDRVRIVPALKQVE